MNSMIYAGLDIHKKSISCCVRLADGTIIQESTIAATRLCSGSGGSASFNGYQGKPGAPDAGANGELRLPS